jgi:type IV secretion system protein VirB10
MTLPPVQNPMNKPNVRKPNTRKPIGDDPRLKHTTSELEAASLQAMPQVAAKGQASDSLVLLGGLLGIAALGGFTFFSLSTQKPAPAPVVVQPPMPQPAPQVQAEPEFVPEPAPIPEPEPQFIQPMPTPQPYVEQRPPTPEPSRAPSLVIDNSSQNNSSQPGAAGGSADLLNPNEQFAARVGGDSSKAQPISDPSTIVPQGALIAAVLETALNSDLPGYARALVSRDVRSFDGTKVLIPRGSRLIGQYKSGLASGTTRAFVIWSRLIRPDGVSIQLASPATDALGQAGLSGKVDNHFAQRFGAAILLSIVNGLASSANSNNGSTVVIGSASGAQNIASEALSANSKISPTIKVLQGTAIQIFVARDLDFGV